MSMLIKYPGIQKSFSFLSNKDFEKEHQKFLSSDLGLIYQAIPWEKLVKKFKLTESERGPQSTFSPRGQLALMVLKSYSQTSDYRLLQQINGNIHYQLFCGIQLAPGQALRDHKIISRIRCKLAQQLEMQGIENVQYALGDYWTPYLKNKSKVLIDATCYESEVRYPTDLKLLWESVALLHKIITDISINEGITLIRTKFRKWERRFKEYIKKRIKRKKNRKAITRGLLRLLVKLNAYLGSLETKYAFDPPKKYQEQRNTIRIILEQQQHFFDTEIPPKNRIVSIFKPYLRPIVRCKEARKCEFGAKANKIQIDGLSFIQKISFDTFNEGTQFKESIFQAERITKVKMKEVGADAIYATNANRKFATSEGIATDFSRKGRAGKNEKQRKKTASRIRKERSSSLEGSFGTEKENYSLRKIKARTRPNEILWIFFGIHTANALKVGRRMSKAVSARLVA